MKRLNVAVFSSSFKPFVIPASYLKPIAALMEMVRLNPRLVSAEGVRDLRTGKSGKIVLVSKFDDSMFFIEDAKDGKQGMCGAYPLLKGVKDGNMKLKLRNKSIALSDLKMVHRNEHNKV